MNPYAKTLLRVKKKTFENIPCQELGLPFFNRQGRLKLRVKGLINEQLYQWRRTAALVNQQKWWLWVGQLLSNVDTTVLENEIVTFHTLIEGLPELVYWKDNHYVYRGCNKQTASYINVNSTSDIIGKTDYDFGWTEERIKGLRDIDSTIIHQGISSVVEDLIPIKGGKAEIFLTSKRPLYNKRGKIIGILGISTNITERKKIEQELKIAKEAAEMASRAKSDFIANMSHDIRTPLSGVIGLSKLLESTLEDPDQKNDAHILHESGVELLSMLNAIIDDVRIGNLKEDDIQVESFDLHRCLDDLIKLERPTTTLKNIGLFLEIPTEVPPWIQSDRKKIHRTLLNLLGNAIKFTQTGHITIRVKCLQQDDLNCHLQFSVSDTGIGIPNELQDKVFERFFRVTPTYKGTYKGHGLGLHIARTYVELLGGKLSLTSQEGIGTTFSFDLFCQKGVPKEVATDNTTPHEYAQNISLPKGKSSHCFLLVEDNVMALKVLESMFNKLGYSYKSASTGKKALELFKKSSIDLVITDIGLPDMTGYEVAAQIRSWEKENTKTPVVILGLTGHAKELAQKESLEAGIDDVYMKPITLELLQRMVQSYLNQTQKVNSDVKKADGNLTETENKSFELEGFPLFDPQMALESLNQDKQLVIELLQEFIADTGQNDICLIKQAYEEQDWEKIQNLAHKLKSGAVYLGINRLQLACQYLERYYKSGQRSKLIQLYQQLLQVNEETILAARQWLNSA